MTNADKIRQMSDFDLEELIKNEFVFSDIKPEDVRIMDDVALTFALKRTCRFCEYRDGFCSSGCSWGRYSYLTSEVENEITTSD